jgi:hypothetical protein
MIADKNGIQIPSQVTDFHDESDGGKLGIAKVLVVIWYDDPH